MKIYILQFWILITISSFANAQTSIIDTSKTKILRVDPKYAIGVTASQLFDEVTFLPLETSQKSMFGAISQMEVARDCYIIYDQDTGYILLFGLNGSFKNKFKVKIELTHTNTANWMK